MTDPRSAPSIFTRGAVDLGALRQPAPAPPRGPAPAAAQPRADGPASRSGAAAPRTGSGVAIIDVTEATFRGEVLERSLTTPVVIDFWAEWCGPCKQLSPVLEKLAVEANGAWVLAKVDVDANPGLAQALGIQGIPAVFAAIGGQLAPGFTGVQPEAQIRQFIDAVLKAGGVAVDTPVDPRLDAADDALMAGDLDGAEAAYKKILGEMPGDLAAAAGLAQVELLRRVSGVDPQAALTAARKAPDDIGAQTLAADVEVLAGKAAEAYQRLVDLIRRTSGDDRETVRRHLLSLFNVAGPDDPAVAAARRALANALF